MRAALLVATALVALLAGPAGAQPVPDARPNAAAAVRMPRAKMRVVRHQPAKPAPAAVIQAVPAAPSAPVAIESMDLSRIGQPPAPFTIPAASGPVAPAAVPVPPVADIAATGADSPPVGEPRGARIDPVAGTEPAIMLRADADVGAAAFRSGNDVVVVLDAPVVFQAPDADLDPAFAHLTSRATTNATVVRIPMETGQPRLARAPKGWIVTLGPPATAPTPILPRLDDAGSEAAGYWFPASAASRVVTVLDPRNGERLLVGTQTAPGQAVPNAWRQDAFMLLPSWQGVVVAARSDDLRLRRVPDGFTLSSNLQAETASAAGKRPESERPVAGALSRVFDIPNGTLLALQNKLRTYILEAGTAPALARTEPRMRAAETMLGLGLDVEAQAVADVAAAADPALIDTPRFIGLRAAAALLAGRLDDAAALEDPRLNGSTEAELWRALLHVAKDEPSAADADGLADSIPLALAYPDSLRDRVLPVALETMALNGKAGAAQAVLKTLPEGRGLDLARANTLEMLGKSDDALKLYDRVVNRSDRLPAYKAMIRAAEMRIKSGVMDARAGADALDRALLGWRAAKPELDLRMRIADLRRQAGQWHEALGVLRDGRDALPGLRPRIDQKMSSVFTALLADDATKHLSPADFVALYDQNRDLVQDIAWTEKTGMDLVDRLVGLGLQGRAESLMARIVGQAQDAARRADLGARLAGLRMTMNNPAGVIEALSATAPPVGADLPPAVIEARQMLYARAELGRRNVDRALEILTEVDAAEADRLRAQIYTSRKDWPKTVAALSALERKEITSPDVPPDKQAIVMRLAVAAQLGGDTATLGRLAQTYGPAMAKGPSASLFRLVTSAPARAMTDLPRAFEEIQLAKKVIGQI